MDINSKNNVQVGVMTSDEYKQYLEKFHGRAYTEEELVQEFNIVSVAYGGILCSKKDTEDLVLFNKAVSPVSDDVFFVKIGGF